MLLSLRELVVWTGLGPFEASVHAFSLAILSLLLTLRVEDVFNPSWHVIFIPLYAALGITTYYDIILYIRMFSFGWKESKRFLLYILLMNLLGVGVLLATEVVVAEYLDGRAAPATLVVFIALIFGYLLARMPLAFRALKHSNRF